MEARQNNFFKRLPTLIMSTIKNRKINPNCFLYRQSISGSFGRVSIDDESCGADICMPAGYINIYQGMHG
eukprot:scaffold2253_cov119-Cylindrotheca_fusiformis.AAC.23